MIQHLKRILKRLFFSVIRSETLDTNYCQVQGWKILCICFNHQISFWGVWISVVSYENNCSENEERLISFSYTIWFMISEKNITRCTFLHRGTCKHQKSQRGTDKILSALKLHLLWTSDFYWYEDVYITGGRSFKTFLKENYAIAYDSCYWFTKKC